MNSHLTVKAMRWWTAAPPAGGLLGAVLVDDSITGTVRVFIGGAYGHDELEDAELIARWGASVDPDLGRAMFPAYAEREWRS